MHYLALLVGLIRCDIFLNTELNNLLGEKKDQEDGKEQASGEVSTGSVTDSNLVKAESNSEMNAEQPAPKADGGAKPAGGAKPSGGGAAGGAKPGAGGGVKPAGGAKDGAKPGAGGAKDGAKPGGAAGASKGSGQISTINVNGKEAVMVKGGEGKDVPSIVVISDQGVMKNEAELIKLAGEIGGSVGKEGGDKKTPGAGGAKPGGDKKAAGGAAGGKPPGGGGAKPAAGGGAAKPAAGGAGAAKQKLTDVSELETQGLSLLSFETEEGTQEGEKARESLDNLIEVSKKKNNKSSKGAFWTTVLVDNNPRKVLVNVKTITVLESISDKKIEKDTKKPTKDKDISPTTGTITQKDTKTSAEKKETKQTEKKKEEQKSRSPTKKDDENKTDNKKTVVDGIKYEGPDVKPGEPKKEDKPEGVLGGIFGKKKDTPPSSEASTKRLKTGESSATKEDQKSIKKETSTSQSSSSVKRTSNDEQKTGDKASTSTTIAKTKTTKKADKKEKPESTVESVVFMGSKIPQKSVKSEKTEKEVKKSDKGKDKTASLDDLLFVLKNMPGKVNTNKGGRELYVEGDFQTPKEEKTGRNKYKFFGLIKADHQK